MLFYFPLEWETDITEEKQNVYVHFYEGWNFNSGNYLFTTDTK